MKQYVLLLILSSTALSIEAGTFFNKAAFKKTAAVVGGTALAFTGHYLCEFMSTFCHELGHASACKLTTGNSAHIQLQNELNPLAPWTGYTVMPSCNAQNKTKDAAITAAGPLAGIGTTLAQIYILQTLEHTFTTRKQKDTAPPPLSIRAYFKNLYEAAHTTTSTFVKEGKTPEFCENPLLIASKILTFLRYSRIVGEGLYGFTPISVPRVVGDGQKLWSMLLNSDEQRTIISHHLVTITSAIMLSPILLGFLKGLTKF